MSRMSDIPTFNADIIREYAYVCGCFLFLGGMLSLFPTMLALAALQRRGVSERRALDGGVCGSLRLPRGVAQRGATGTVSGRVLAGLRERDIM